MQFALITPSYAPDYERCKLLCQSVDRFAPDDVRHYVVVDRRDRKLFSSLAGPNREILIVEDIIPKWIFRLPGAKRWWLSLRTAPIRNWVLQQLVKLSMAQVCQEDVFIFVDSDVTFIRPFSTERFLNDGLVRLNRVDFQSESHARWLQSAREILHLDKPDIPQVNYVANLVTWRRENLLKMYEHIAKVNGKAWLPAIANHWHISEYTIYGVFVEHVLGLENARHYPGTTPILHLSWDYPLNTPEDVDRFLADAEPHHIGIMIHSKDAIPLDRYIDQVRACWTSTATT